MNGTVNNQQLPVLLGWQEYFFIPHIGLETLAKSQVSGELLSKDRLNILPTRVRSSGWSGGGSSGALSSAFLRSLAFESSSAGRPPNTHLLLLLAPTNGIVVGGFILAPWRIIGTRPVFIPKKC